MKTQKYEITINANKNKVWEVLWTDETYRKWTSAFSEVSSAHSDWEEGSRIIFGDGKGNGMFSLIEKKDAPNTIVFRHLGELKDGVETPFAPESGWANSLERYYLTDENGQTKVTCEVDVDVNFLDFMNNSFPKAFAILKELSEA
jgi:uncharacterized protein YndB with AHSA1/START domain